MQANAQSGKLLIEKYLGNNPKLAKKRQHSLSVGSFAAKVAKRIADRNPELDLNVELCEFLGYCHDIGYSIADDRHEIHTIALLQAEGIDPDTARRAMHGQLAEQFGEKEGNVRQYLPVGIEGIILTYCDMSVRFGEPVTIKERAREIIERIGLSPTMPDALKKDIGDNLIKALPRFERYGQIVLAMAGLKSEKEF